MSEQQDDDRKPVDRTKNQNANMFNKVVMPIDKAHPQIVKPNPKRPPVDPARVAALNLKDKNVGFDNVVHIFDTSIQAPREFYMNSQRDNKNFVMESYPVTYDNVGESGQMSTIRINRNEFEQGFENVEATIYLKAEQPIAANPSEYQRLSFSWGQTLFGLAENMPTYEIMYPTASHPDPSFHIVFTPDTFLANRDTKVYFAGGRLVEGQWIAVKFVCLTTKTKETTWMGIWVDVDPLDMAYTPPRPKNNFKFKSESVYTGFIGDDHPPVKTWRSDYDTFRVDGFEKVTVMNVSMREIEVSDFNPFSDEYLKAHRDYKLIRDGIDSDELKVFKNYNKATKKE